MDWIAEEMSTINLGDERLNKRTIKLLEKMHGNPEDSIPKICQSWQETKAAYRYFDNPKVTQEKVLSPHQTSSIERIKKQKRVLLLQDTTELNYSTQQQKQGAGPSHFDNEKVRFFHPLLAVTPEKLSLGVLDIHTWYREELLSKKHEKNICKHSGFIINRSAKRRVIAGYWGIGNQQPLPNVATIRIL